MQEIPEEQLSPLARLLPTRLVAERYSVHLRSVARWVRGGILPPPSAVINGRNYWDLAVLEKADREHTVASGSRRMPAQLAPAAKTPPAP
jgi:hypothetical protein